MEGNVKLPFETWETILDQLKHPFQWSLNDLAVCALVDKLFNRVASSRLYKAVRTLPDSEDPVDAKQLAIFQSIAKHPALGQYVQTFECWHKDDCSEFFNEAEDDPEGRIRIALAAFRAMTNLRVLAVTPTAIGEYFIETCHEKQWSLLQELHVWGKNPLRFMWNPAKVLRNNVLSNLTTLVWTFYSEDFLEPFRPPFAPPKAESALICTVSFLVAVVELCCPSLVHLEVSASPHYNCIHPHMDYWKDFIAVWMVNNRADFSDVLDRAQQAYAGIVPCKITHLRTLAINLFNRECEEDCRIFLQWASSFFCPQLHTVTTLRIPLIGIVDSRDHGLLRQICTSSGPNIRALDIQSPMNDDPKDLDPSRDGIFAALYTPFPSAPDQSPRTSLQNLTIHHLTPFSPEGARPFQDFPCLLSLSLCLHIPKNHACGAGGWFQPDEFLSPLVNFVALLPTTLETLKLISAPPGRILDEDAENLSVRGVSLCHILPRLRSFDLELKLETFGNWPLSYPQVQVYVRRLAHWHIEREGKVVATTTFLNRDAAIYGCETSHRSILKREFACVQSQSPPFEGLDEDEAYTYTPSDMELIKWCHCKSDLRLWDTRVGTWTEEPEDLSEVESEP